MWLAFFAKTLFYSSFLPLWEGYDEYSHFEYVRYLSNNHRLPTLQSDGSREVAASLALSPGPWPCQNLRPICLGYADFWQLPEPERQLRLQQLRSLPPAWQGLPANPPLDLYEAQQPPLAYFLYVTPYRLYAETTLWTRVWILRVVAGFIASLTIPLGFRVARQVFPDDASSLGVIALSAALPEWLMNVTRVGNEPLAAVLATAIVGTLIAFSRQRYPPTEPQPSGSGPTPGTPKYAGIAARLGALLGTALITKGYFLTLIPAIGTLYTIAWLRRWQSLRSLSQQIAVIASLALAISGWWYVRAYLLTGALTGQMEEVAAGHSKLSVWQAIVQTDWLKVLDLALVSHIWVGGWSFLVVRAWMYRVIEVLIVLAIVGIAYRALRIPAGRRTLAALVLPQVFLWLGLAYHAFASFRGYGVSGTLSHYAYCLVIPEAACLILGLRTLVPAVARRWIIPGLVLSMTALECFAVHIYQLPYYAGLIAHGPRGNVPALHFSQLQDGGAAAMFERLSSSNLGFVSKELLIVFWALYLVAMIALLPIAFLGSGKQKAGTI